MLSLQFTYAGCTPVDSGVRNFGAAEPCQDDFVQSACSKSVLVESSHQLTGLRLPEQGTSPCSLVSVCNDEESVWECLGATVVCSCRLQSSKQYCES
jgi:hypothetical protein